MNKLKLFLFLLFMITVSFKAEASLKTDISAFVSRVSSTVNNTVENIKIKINTAAQKVQEWYTGSKIHSTLETVRALKEDVQTTSSSIQDSYEDTKNSIGGIGDDLVGDYEKQIEDLKDAQKGNPIELTQQLQEIENKIKDRKDVLQSELDAKNSAAQANIAMLQAMYNELTDETHKLIVSTEIKEAQKKIDAYNEYLEQIQSGEGDYLDSDNEYSKLQQEKKHIMEQLAALSGSAGGNLSDKFGDAFASKGDAELSAEYNKVISDNFLLKEEDETAENVARVNAHRQSVLVQDIAHAFYTAIQIKQGLEADLERIERKKDNMAAVDYKITSVNLLIDQKIEDINILYNYTNLMIADLRLKTSQNMFRQKYRLRTYDKDPAVLNLDNYIFTKEDIPTDEGQKSFLDDITRE